MDVVVVVVDSARPPPPTSPQKYHPPVSQNLRHRRWHRALVVGRGLLNVWETRDRKYKHQFSEKATFHHNRNLMNLAVDVTSCGKLPCHQLPQLSWFPSLHACRRLFWRERIDSVNANFRARCCLDPCVSGTPPTQRKANQMFRPRESLQATPLQVSCHYADGKTAGREWFGVKARNDQRFITFCIPILTPTWNNTVGVDGHTVDISQVLLLNGQMLLCHMFLWASLTHLASIWQLTAYVKCTDKLRVTSR